MAKSRIVLHVTRKDFNRWNKMWKKIRATGMVSEVIAKFVLDQLHDDEKRGFESLKKYVG